MELLIQKLRKTYASPFNEYNMLTFEEYVEEAEKAGVMNELLYNA